MARTSKCGWTISFGPKNKVKNWNPPPPKIDIHHMVATRKGKGEKYNP